MDIILASNIDNSVIESLADGPGVRLVIFTCGCPHHCKGCHNPKSWDMSNGVKVATDELANYVVNKLTTGNYSGLTISGGDPFLQSEAVNEFISLVKKEIPDLNIWCYSGFIFEEVKGNELLKNINVLIDGRFEEDKKFPRKKFRGSYNQRILHLLNGEIISEE